jgi:large conductance mechanosensitive channel
MSSTWRSASLSVAPLPASSIRWSRISSCPSSAVTAPTLAQAREQGAVFAYGSFITVFINFLILAFIIFLMVKGVNKLRSMEEKKPPEMKPAPPPADIQLLSEIRDILKTK